MASNGWVVLKDTYIIRKADSFKYDSTIDRQTRTRYASQLLPTTITTNMLELANWTTQWYHPTIICSCLLSFLYRNMTMIMVPKPHKDQPTVKGWRPIVPANTIGKRAYELVADQLQRLDLFPHLQYGSTIGRRVK